MERPIFTCGTCGKHGYLPLRVIVEDTRSYWRRQGVAASVLVAVLLVVWILSLLFGGAAVPKGVQRIAASAGTAMLSVPFIMLVTGIFPRTRTEEERRCASCGSASIALATASEVVTPTKNIPVAGKEQQRRFIIGAIIFIIAIAALIALKRIWR